MFSFVLLSIKKFTYVLKQKCKMDAFQLKLIYGCSRSGLKLKDIKLDGKT